MAAIAAANRMGSTYLRIVPDGKRNEGRSGQASHRSDEPLWRLQERRAAAIHPPVWSRSVAQPGSAHRSGRWGRRFKSCHSDQNFQRLSEYPEKSLAFVDADFGWEPAPAFLSFRANGDARDVQMALPHRACVSRHETGRDVSASVPPRQGEALPRQAGGEASKEGAAPASVSRKRCIELR